MIPFFFTIKKNSLSTRNTSDTKCVRLLHQAMLPALWGHQVFCNFNYINSINIIQFWYQPPELAQTFQIKGSMLQDRTPLQTPISSSVPRWPALLFDLATNCGFPWPSPQVWSFAITAHRTQGKHFTYYYQFIIKSIRKDERSLEASHAQDLLSLCSSACGCVHQSGSFSTPLFMVFIVVPYWLNHWPLVMGLNLQPLSLASSQRSGMGQKVPTLWSNGWLLWWQPHPPGITSLI